MVIIMHKTLSDVLPDNINNKHIVSFYVCNSARNTLNSASKWEQKQTEKQQQQQTHKDKRNRPFHA